MLKKLSRPLAAAAAGVTAAAVLAACSSSPTGSAQAVTYAPAAYGVPGHCYYVNYPAEATALIAAGLCPRGWVPTQAPLAWEEEYADYYDSDAYVTTYVPAVDRVTYRSTQTRFYTRYRVTIISAEKSAVYRSSTGATVKGYTGSAMKFSGGNGSTLRNGGGSARSGGGSGVSTCSLNMTTITLRGGTTSGGGSARSGTSSGSGTSRGTTSGGGSARSGGTTSRTGTSGGC
jgi:hypothetical protein